MRSKIFHVSMLGIAAVFFCAYTYPALTTTLQPLPKASIEEPLPKMKEKSMNVKFHSRSGARRTPPPSGSYKVPNTPEASSPLLKQKPPYGEWVEYAANVLAIFMPLISGGVSLTVWLRSRKLSRTMAGG